ncbi:MAG TPA: NrfD/PsrC family molybdoenzyme membrane anchor subunit, partial [Thermomicrobiales bacterium]|nr:NrfD/PsrC family molybdoenzyme membrane anchor subunit [Thermomicrobiales bacterium]
MRKSQRLPGYYGLPVIHKVHWKWLIIVYFFLGGIAGAAQAIAGVAAVRDRDRNRPIVRAARYVSALAFVPCPALLMVDLGRPERFFHMLRIVKLRSPMSIGSWTLTLFGAATTAVA